MRTDTAETRVHIAGSVPEVNFVATRIRRGNLSADQRTRLTQGLTSQQWQMLADLVPLTEQETMRRDSLNN